MCATDYGEIKEIKIGFLNEKIKGLNSEISGRYIYIWERERDYLHVS